MKPSNRWKASLIVAVALALVAMPISLDGAGSDTPASWSQLPVTKDGSPYSLSPLANGAIEVHASSYTGENEREFLWVNTAPTEANTTVCMQWSSGGLVDQEGAVLRLKVANGVFRAITVMRNIWGDKFYYINFVSWNSESAVPFTILSGVNLAGYLTTSTSAIYPLNFCARAAGDTVEFIVWKQNDSKPHWGSILQGGAARIPPGYFGVGKEGVYIGHLIAPSSAVISNVTIDGRTFNPRLAA